MEVVGSVAAIVQLVSLTGDILALGYGFIAKVKKAPAEIRTLLREITSLNVLLDQLHDLAQDGTSTIGQSAIAALDRLDVFTDCESLMGIVGKQIRACEPKNGQEIRNLGRNMMWPFKEKDTKDTIILLGRLTNTLSAAVTVDSAKALWNLESIARSIDRNSIEALQNILHVQDNVTEINLTTARTAKELAKVGDNVALISAKEEQAAIRRWLHQDGIESNAVFDSALKNRNVNTGIWLLASNYFQEWLAGQHHSCIWLYGIAGCGKTMLSAAAIDYLQQPAHKGKSTVLFFFCNRRDPNKQSIQDLLQIIVKQLLDQNEICFGYVKRWREEKLPESDGLPKPLTTSEYISLIQRICSRWNSVYLVVDAVDQCTDLDDFVNGLERLMMSSNIRCFLTSRHNVELARALKPISGYSISVAENMGDDIHIYLSDEVKDRLVRGKLKLKDPGLEQFLVVSLERNAKGMILIAKLQLDYICRLKSDRAIKEALLKLPTEIYATYDEVLRQVLNQNPEEADSIKQVLRWLVYSIVPLTLPEVAEIIAIRPEDKYLDRSGVPTDLLDLAASLGSLVNLQTQSTTGSQYDDLRGPRIVLITLAHYSVEEYLKSGKMDLALAKDFQMDPVTAHRELAKLCLHYVGFSDFVDPIPTTSVSDTVLAQTIVAELEEPGVKPAFSAQYSEASEQEFTEVQEVYDSTKSSSPDRRRMSLAKDTDIFSPKTMFYDEPHLGISGPSSKRLNSPAENITSDSGKTASLTYGELLNQQPGSTSTVKSIVHQWLSSSEQHMQDSPASQFITSKALQNSLQSDSLGLRSQNSGLKYVRPSLLSTRKHDLKHKRQLLRNRTSRFAFYDYACRYWTEHFRFANFSKSAHPEVRTLLSWFLTASIEQGSRYISWQQMFHRDVIYYCPDRPPLFYAIDFKVDLLVEMLLPKGSMDVLFCGVSPLHVAARSGDLKTARRIISLGASVDFISAKDPTGMTSQMTALHFAAEGGHSEMIRLLLSHGADPNHRNESSSTPMFRAARSGSLKALRALYEAGGNLNAQKRGITPLFEALAQCRPRVACQLLHWGADPSIVNCHRTSSISLLCEAHNQVILKEHWRNATFHTSKDFDFSAVFVTEDEIRNEIYRIRKRGKGPMVFMHLMKGMKRQYILLKQMEKDTRPGTEREKDYRHLADPTKIVTTADFCDRVDEDVDFF